MDPAPVPGLQQQREQDEGEGAATAPQTYERLATVIQGYGDMYYHFLVETVRERRIRRKRLLIFIFECGLSRTLHRDL